MKLTAADYARILDDVTRDAPDAKLSARVAGFLRLLGARRGWALLPRIIDRYREISLERAGLTEIRVSSATTISKEELASIAREAGFDPARVRWITAVDPTLHGGLRVRVGDTVIRGSFKDRIDSLSHQIV